MPNGVFLIDREYTFRESVQFLARAILSTDDKNEGIVFSIVDLLRLFRSINAHVPDEFDIQRTHSHYYKIVYKSKEEVVESFKDRWEGLLREEGSLYYKTE